MNLNRAVLFLKVFFLFLLGFELSRLYFILYHLDGLEDGFLKVWLTTSFEGFALDVSTVMYCMAPLVLLVFVEGLIRKPLPIWYFKFFVVFDLVCVFCIGIADPEFFRQWNVKFNNQVLVYINHPKEMAVSTGAVLWSKTLLFSLVFAALLYALYTWLSGLFKKRRDIGWKHSLADLLSLGLCFVFLRGGIGVTAISQASAIYSTNRLYNAAAVNSLWNAIYYVINDVENIYGDSYKVFERAELERLFSEQMRGDTARLDLTDKDKPNVIVVLLESFTASASLRLQGQMDCMPNLDRIADENLSFLSCYSSGERTEKGLVSVVAGYPAQPMSSIIVFPDKMSKLNSMGKVLGSMGYHNSFYYGGDAEFASMKSFLIVHGIDNIVDKRNFEKKQLNSKWGAHDSYVFDRVLNDLSKVKPPFYCNVLTLSSHEPYEVPYKSIGDSKDIWYPYKNSIRYSDSCLAAFLEACEKQPWYSNTLIVLVADHGHDIGLKDVLYFGKEKYHIPLVITGGALRKELKGVAYRQVVSQTIIPSLILGSMGLPVDDFQWQTGVFHPDPFAQFQYNYGFGRVEKKANCLKDNLSPAYDFFGDKADSLSLQKRGKVFQQKLIEDFIQK